MFRLDPNEPIHREIRRLVLDEFDDAAQALEGGDEPLAVRIHEARKRLKRLRAVLALVAETADAQLVRALVDMARSAARTLAGPRGHAALLHSFESLIGNEPDCDNAVVGRARAARAPAGA
ncbi:MAG: hypothetical protein ACOY0T_03740, partial [Myxococcota bacterium]